MSNIWYTILNFVFLVGFVASAVFSSQNYLAVSAAITKIESCQGRLCEINGENLRNSFNQFLISVLLLFVFYNLRIWLRQKDRARRHLGYLRENKTRFTPNLQEEYKNL